MWATGSLSASRCTGRTCSASGGSHAIPGGVERIRARRRLLSTDERPRRLALRGRSLARAATQEGGRRCSFSPTPSQPRSVVGAEGRVRSLRLLRTERAARTPGACPHVFDRRAAAAAEARALRGAARTRKRRASRRPALRAGAKKRPHRHSLRGRSLSFSEHREPYSGPSATERLSDDYLPAFCRSSSSTTLPDLRASMRSFRAAS